MDEKYGSSKHSDLKLVPSAIRRAILELHGVVIVSRDGLTIAHDFPEAGMERIAVIAATVLGPGKRISERINMGDPAESVIHDRDDYLVVHGVGEDVVLVVQGPIELNLGLMRTKARVAAVEIKQLLTTA